MVGSGGGGPDEGVRSRLGTVNNWRERWWNGMGQYIKREKGYTRLKHADRERNRKMMDQRHRENVNGGG